ncbi:MAG: transcription termination factor Rho [Anaerolineae bacterium]
MPDTISGVLQRTKKGTGVLRDPAQSFRPGPDDPVVPAKLMQAFDLVEGASVSGPLRKGKQGLELAQVEAVCGLSPEAFRQRRPFARLVAIDPCERFHLAVTGQTSMRLIDLVAPIGKGTRGLIVSPPKAGKTILLEQLAKAIRTAEPETRIIVLLIDERPEEVTHFRRAVEAEVLASSSDQSVREHVALAELVLAHVRTELECGHDIVLLVDSLTRMSRTFNLKGSGSGRTLSGGVDAGALQFPRRFFGLARNIEDGGSVTILATTLVDTGSRMDDFIFEEFKGTGNSEIVLDRSLAEAYIFPAINLLESGTRKPERLYSPDGSRRVGLLRRRLAGRDPREAMEVMLGLLEKYPTNEALLQSLPAGKR